MIRTLYIHIGTPKTGTSTLQHFFEDNRAALLQKGIYYPEKIDSGTWGGKDSTDGNFAWITRCDKSVRDISDIFNHMFSISNKVLLSTENIWLEIKDKGDFLLNLKQMLEGTEIKVIVYLRKQIDYLESQYRECVRLILAQESIFEVCDSSNPAFSVVKESLNYYAVLENMAQAVGRENIIVRPYEKMQFKNQNILEDFMGILGLSLVQPFVLPEKNYNPPMNNPALELKRNMNTSAKAEQKLMNDCFYEILMQDGTERAKNGECAHFKSLLTYQQRHDFMQRFEEGNRKIAVHYLNREEGKLFFEENDVHMQTGSVSSEDLLQQTIRVFTSAFLENYDRQNTIVHNHNAFEKKMEHFIGLIQNMVENQQKQMEIYQKEMESSQRHMEDQVYEYRKDLMRMLQTKQQEIDELKNSSCWRITAPLRKIVDSFKKLKYR